MSVRMVILGLLREKPLYGYEIKQIIEEHMGDWTSIAFGSIYFALEKLTEEKFTEKAATERRGRRPSRCVYQITRAGRAEFQRLLREGWQNFEQQHFELDLCLLFLKDLPAQEVIGYLRRRQGILREVLEHLKSHRAEQLALPQVPKHAAAIFDHSTLHVQAELTWVNDLLKKMEGGEYT
jgi:DNA-binding PadR family transcriptional regulator